MNRQGSTVDPMKSFVWVLVAVVPSFGERVAVSESMNRDLNKVSVWCNL